MDVAVILATNAVGLVTIASSFYLGIVDKILPEWCCSVWTPPFISFLGVAGRGAWVYLAGFTLMSVGFVASIHYCEKLFLPAAGPRGKRLIRFSVMAARVAALGLLLHAMVPVQPAFLPFLHALSRADGSAPPPAPDTSARDVVHTVGAMLLFFASTVHFGTFLLAVAASRRSPLWAGVSRLSLLVKCAAFAVAAASLFSSFALHPATPHPTHFSKRREALLFGARAQWAFVSAMFAWYGVFAADLPRLRAALRRHHGAE